ncbi:hypothetical protein FB451DRAFT_1173325 [Mycena latifolia]|nr:hypothetical protein FB451DRAFT_1173325 [Mycena latifolia]
MTIWRHFGGVIGRRKDGPNPVQRSAAAAADIEAKLYDEDTERQVCEQSVLPARGTGAKRREDRIGRGGGAYSTGSSGSERRGICNTVHVWTGRGGRQSAGRPAVTVSVLTGAPATRLIRFTTERDRSQPGSARVPGLGEGGRVDAADVDSRARERGLMGGGFEFGSRGARGTRKRLYCIGGCGGQLGVRTAQRGAAVSLPSSFIRGYRIKSRLKYVVNGGARAHDTTPPKDRDARGAQRVNHMARAQGKGAAHKGRARAVVRRQGEAESRMERTAGRTGQCVTARARDRVSSSAVERASEGGALSRTNADAGEGRFVRYLEHVRSRGREQCEQVGDACMEASARAAGFMVILEAT